MAETLTLTVDAFLEGDRLRRGVRLEVRDDALSYEDVRLPLAGLFWVARRGGLLLAFARDYTAAFRASEHRLDDLREAIDRRVDAGARQSAFLEPLAGETILCSAGVAVSGTLVDTTGDSARPQAVRGLHVAVFTRHALHLFSRTETRRVAWPVGEAREATDSARPARPALELRQDGSVLTILYLRPEEIDTALAAAGQHPPEAGERDEAIEMFARREVAGPTPARLPEFTTSAETIRGHAERHAARVPAELRLRASLPEDYFVEHLRELGETALGPLLFRKSAASRARSLAKAVEAMDAGALQDDARAAAQNALGRLTDAFERELHRLLAGKRRAQKRAQELAMSEALRDSLRGRFLAPVHKLTPQLQRLERAQAELLVRLRRLEEGPPEGEESGLDQAADEWHRALVVVDRDFDTAWKELLPEICSAWSESLLPQLGEAAAAPRQRVPEWAKLMLIGLLTLLVVASAVLVLRH